MLYDPKWRETESLVVWLAKQPASKGYQYLDYGGCLIAQYLTDAGFREVSVYSDGTFEYRRPSGRQAANHYPEAFNSIAIQFPRTIGAALTRARARAVLMERAAA